ncbi:MAG: exodeoxyribonuclease VII large subunit [Planctomycetes bacterium]|nr:exodeoxyribonuclease VII large subunit [Planctomycetota bacterium]
MSLPAELPFPAERRAISVGDLTRRIKKLLEDNIRYVWVAGEISNFRPAASGHCYFTLKDEEAQIGCALWKPIAARLRFRPEDGMDVLAWGRVEVYAPHGKYQLIIEDLEPRGAGALAIRFEQLKAKLEAEGLFDAGRKRALPLLPRAIGIVTSPVGAALQDMLRTLTSRCPTVPIYFYPVKVQGEGAAEEIAAAIGHLNLAMPDLDVLIVGRGGGSIEDLWAFNEEVVARAIHASRIPIVSAVGHETDFTIADFTADIRALTPTDAAMKVVPKRAELIEMLDRCGAQLRRALESRAELARSILDGHRNGHALREPQAVVRRLAQRLDELHERLSVALGGAVAAARERLAHWWRTASNELAHAGRATRERAESLRRHLQAVSPLAVLNRGYSITRAEDGGVIRSTSAVKPGQFLRTTLADGEIRSRVEEREKK